MRISPAGRERRHVRFAGLTVITAVMIAVTAAFFSLAPVRAQLAALFEPTSPAPVAFLGGEKTAPPPSLAMEPTARAPVPAAVARQSTAVPAVNGGKLQDRPLAPSSVLSTPITTAAPIGQRPLLVQQDNNLYVAPTPVQPPEAGRLTIPTLGVSQVVVEVPVVAGQWDISSLETGIGRLQTTGKQPGDDLAMAFIGHVTVPWPGQGPFANLIQLEHGEEVIYRWQGVDYVYEVERIFLVSPGSVATLYVQDGRRILLATCNDWDSLNWNYAKRLVTQAKLVRREPIPYR